jgi:N-acyl homoserine lactone hydrolase
LGLKDSDIDAVYFSHLDFDHTSGICLVKNAKAFYASSEEIADARKNRIRYVDTWTGIVDIKPFEYENSGIGPVGKSFDVFGDGTVILVNIPGIVMGFLL